MKGLVRPYLLLFFLLLSVIVHGEAIAQRVDISEERQVDGRILVDFRFDWDDALQQMVDSSGVSTWSDQVLEAFTGGLQSAAHTIRLSSLVLPEVRVLSRQFDEVNVAISQNQAPNRASDVWLEGLGISRKQPLVELVASVFSLSSQEGVLRRYRSIRVELTPDMNRTVNRSASKGSSVVESVLSSGSLFRISIADAGVYRINRSFLLGIGLDPDTIDPNQIGVFSNGGLPLPALNSLDRPKDLNELPVERIGGGDGNFGSADEVLFYARGANGWTYADSAFEHYIHPFSNDNAVFIKIGTSLGASLPTSAFDSTPSNPETSVTEGRHFVDLEEQVWVREHGTGQDWMSNTIRSGGSRTIYSDLSLPGLLAGTVQYQARVAIASNPRATVAMSSAGTTLGQRTASLTTFPGAENPSAHPSTFGFSEIVADRQVLDLTMRLLNQANEPQAAVDWIRINYTQELIREEGALFFTTPVEVTQARRFRMRNFSSIPRVWNITDGVLAKSYEVSTSGSDFVVSVAAEDVAARPADLIAFLPDDIQNVSVDQSVPVANQNLHGVSGFPDMVILAPEVFLGAAGRLADIRRSEGLQVELVTQTEVFNEFSGGVPDMRAIRDYLKFLYDRAPVSEIPRYLLLFGDGHYDFRGLSTYNNPLNNLIFPYETEESLRSDASFTSDDYFGLLDDNEGLWVYNSFSTTSTERMDIGIGRFPVQTVAEAEMVVDKVISYEDPSTHGSWRSEYTMVADDGPTGLSGQQDDADLHLANVDQVAELVATQLYPQINLRKIYGETYERVFLNGFRIPDAKKEINDTLNRGTLLLNYSGHGGPDGLAQEEIFTKEDALALTNKDKLAIFVTATCSFGWWDLEETQSGAEALLLNPNGGAVALMTTVRLVYTSGSTTSLNAGLNRALNIALFEKDSDGLPRRLGDVMRLTKNTNVGLQGNSRKFNLLGDPSMRVGLAPREAVVQTLNSTDLTSETGQMKALDLVSIQGEIQDAAGNKDNSFDGLVSVTVFDAERIVPTKNRRYYTQSFFRDREDLLWRGEVQATAGDFLAEFVVPKDISYSNETGRIAVYAQGAGTQAIGYTEKFIVGGTSDSPPNDDLGPELMLFLNDTTFVAGQKVNEDAELIVQLNDQSGINTVGTGVGHEMLLSLDGNDAAAQDIGSAFVAEPNSYQKGTVTWPLTGMAAGSHTLSVRAWDVLNNSNTAQLSFEVANNEVLDVINVYNYPNPMNRETRFVFEHNQPPGTSAEVQLRIYTLSGRPIRTIHSDEALPEGVLSNGPVQVYWDGKDDDLDRPATGIYLYRLRVETIGADGGRQVSEHVEKLAIIR